MALEHELSFEEENGAVHDDSRSGIGDEEHVVWVTATPPKPEPVVLLQRPSLLLFAPGDFPVGRNPKPFPAKCSLLL